MKAKNVLLFSCLGISLLASSCTYDKDPNAPIKQEAVKYFEKYYQDNPSKEKEPLFFFELETTKGAIVRMQDGVVSAEYLGMLNVTNFSFSENPNKYFIDLGNIQVKLVSGEDGNSFDDFIVGDFYSKKGGFDLKSFAKNPPFILHEKATNGEIKTYSRVSEYGITSSGLKEAYDPNFFFVSDFKIDIGSIGEELGDVLDYSGKDLAILRKDIYTILNSFVEDSEFGKYKNLLNFSRILNAAFKLANGIAKDSSQEVPKDLVFPAYHITSFAEGDTRPVVPGPNGKILDYISSAMGEDKEIKGDPAIWKYENIHLSEGIKQVCFHAFEAKRDEKGDSKSANRNFYLPSTLQDTLFNSFAGLDIDEMYVKRTVDDEGNYKAFGTTSIDGIDYKLGGKKHALRPTFQDTKFKNLYFEDYANENLKDFPFDTTNLDSTAKINETVKIYNQDDQGLSRDKFEKVSEAIDTYDEVNPYLQLVLNTDEEKQKHSFASDLTSIGKGKKLYLPYEEFSIDDTKEREFTINHNRSGKAIEPEAKLTMKLENDLVIEGELVLSSQIGVAAEGSGATIGSYTAIDLNSHKITVKEGGILKAFGLIYDSSENREGNVILENGALLETNLAIFDYENVDSMLFKVANNVKPFSRYSLSSIKSKMEIDAGSTVVGYFNFADEEGAIETPVDFIGKENTGAFIELKEGKINFGLDGLVGDQNSEVIVNDFDFLKFGNEIYSTEDCGFSLSNSEMPFSANKVTLNAHIVQDEGKLLVNDLVLNEGSKLISADFDRVEILGNVTLGQQLLGGKIEFNGHFKVNENNFDSVYGLIEANESRFAHLVSYRYEEDETVTELMLPIKIVVGENDETFAKLYYKYDFGFHYIYLSNYASAKLLRTDDSVIAEYGEGDTSWKVTYTDEYTSEVHENEATNVPYSVRTIDSFVSSLSLEYVLVNSQENVDWRCLNNPIDGIYTIDGVKYIKYANSLIKGEVDPTEVLENSVFIASATREKYVQIQGSWHLAQTFDDNNVVYSFDDSLHYFVFENGYVAAESYDEETHLVRMGDSRFVYQKNLEGNARYNLLDVAEVIELEEKLISLNDKATRALIDNKYWVQPEPEEIGRGSLKFGNKYYFHKFGKWMPSIDGQYAVRYVHDVDTSFGVLETSLNRNGIVYDFVYRDGEDMDEEYKLLRPEARFTLSKDGYQELWDHSDFQDAEVFSAFRYVVINGEKFLYYADDAEEEGEMVHPIKRKFEFANMYTPKNPNAGASNKAEKYAFIMLKVRFYDENDVLGDVETIYIRAKGYGEDNAIMAGNYEDKDSDRYLALCIYSRNNPISDLDY